LTGLMKLGDARSHAQEILEEKLRERKRAQNFQAWRSVAREAQLRPEGCKAFILLGGRGSGKTRAAVEDLLEFARASTIICHVVAPTRGDVKKTCFEGVSGILKCARPGEVVSYNKTDLEIELRNGSIIKGFSAEEPDRLNGPQCHYLLIEEFGLCSVSAIDQAMFGLRLGKQTTFCGSSTPKVRPGTKHVLSLFENMHVSRMRLYDNAANLASDFVDDIRRRYAGTRLERSEIEGELIDEIEGALWEPQWFEQEGFRLEPALFQYEGDPKDMMRFEPPCELVRIVVSIDPSVTDPELKKNPYKDPDACGLGAIGLGRDGRGYVLADVTKVMSPEQWARKAWWLANTVKANNIVAEKNQGGELIKEVLDIYGSGVPIQLVHASQGKRLRAEPVAMLYAQGRVSHCGVFRELEDEMLTWDARVPNQPSPNRIDMLGWGLHALGLCDIQETRHTSGYKAAGR
jgi:phage terminase large subunit-like protein